MQEDEQQHPVDEGSGYEPPVVADLEAIEGPAVTAAGVSKDV